MCTFWLWWATYAVDQEANGIGSGRCLSVPAQVPGFSWRSRLGLHLTQSTLWPILICQQPGCDAHSEWLRIDGDLSAASRLWYSFLTATAYTERLRIDLGELLRVEAFHHELFIATLQLPLTAAMKYTHGRVHARISKSAKT